MDKNPYEYYERIDGDPLTGDPWYFRKSGSGDDTLVEWYDEIHGEWVYSAYSGNFNGWGFDQAGFDPIHRRVDYKDLPVEVVA